MWKQGKGEVSDKVKAINWLYVLMPGSLSLPHKLMITRNYWKISMGLNMVNATMDCLNGTLSPALVKSSYWTIMEKSGY